MSSRVPFADAPRTSFAGVVVAHRAAFARRAVEFDARIERTTRGKHFMLNPFSSSHELIRGIRAVKCSRFALCDHPRRGARVPSFSAFQQFTAEQVRRYYVRATAVDSGDGHFVVEVFYIHEVRDIYTE